MNEETINNLSREEAIKLLDSQMDYTYQLNQRWNELKKYIEEQKDYLTKITGQHIPLNDSFEFCSMNELYQTGKYSGLKDTLIKMQELEEGGNND